MNIQPGERVTIFDAEDRCTLWARCRNMHADACRFDAVFESASNGGLGSVGGWICERALADEGVHWIRGWHTPSKPAAIALLAAGLLDRSAA